jgi:hypothetical protein
VVYSGYVVAEAIIAAIRAMVAIGTGFEIGMVRNIQNEVAIRI